MSPDDPDGGTVLSDGGACAPGLLSCDGICVDPASDPAHCGDCFASCGAGESCVGGECVGGCTPSCADRACGDDGCGGSCGSCPSRLFCSEGTCVSSCTPSCSDRSCGDDGCGGSCGTCPSGYACSFGSCVSSCTPSCSGRSCGDDGCGGSCGTCPSGSSCSSGSCVTSTSSGESCTSPIMLSSSGGTRTFTFTGRSADHTAFGCGTTTGQPDVVFAWTPVGTGTATVRAAGPTSSVDTVLAVFSSSSCTSSYEVACNDDEASGVYSSSASFSVTPFSTYYIAVAPYGTSTPSDTITLTVTSPI